MTKEHIFGELSTIFFCMLFLFLSVIPDARAGKYEITVGGWAMAVERADNLWGKGNRRIDSLGSKAAASTSSLALPYFDAKYIPDYQEGQKGITTLYFNTIAEPGSINVGVRHVFQSGAIDVSGFYSLVAKNWQNPYVLYRTATNTMYFGSRITYAKIMGTNLSLSYKIARTDVDNDVIGGLHSTLRQDGFTHRAIIDYKYDFNKMFSIIPEFSFERGQFDGGSNSYNSYGGGLGFAMRTPFFDLNTRFYGSTAKFDRLHPIFAKTRNENTYGTSVVATFPEPFGWKKYTIVAGINGYQTESNIRFFDRYTMMSLVGLSYKF
ncbi:MAG: DUF2860 family protein [Proteobacteria bacterium]|nr:DUF2860 family protein [Pseudomonadota bacterium]